MNVKERVNLFIEYKDISVKQFEEICSLSNGYISSMRKGFGTEKLDNVLRAYPELNREWLLYGEGEMLKKSQKIENNSGVSQQAGGDIQNSPINESATINKLLAEMAEQRKMYGEHIGQLLKIIAEKQ